LIIWNDQHSGAVSSVGYLRCTLTAGNYYEIMLENSLLSTTGLTNLKSNPILSLANPHHNGLTPVYPVQMACTYSSFLMRLA